MALGQKRLLRHDDVRQRIGCRHDRPDLTAFDIADQIGENLLVKDRATEQAQVFEVKGPQVEIDDWTGYRARHPVAPAALEATKDASELRTADDIDCGVERLVANKAARSASRGMT